ncbi:outer membrane protein [Sphingobacterium corticis]|uniref:Outer membrane protein n=1 Tax=Sphingobacterium corticis TaxID=1812823 RepID=A0ABW5NEE9_9SPHI
MRKILSTVFAIVGLALAGKAQDYGFQRGNVLLEGSFQAGSVKHRNEDVEQVSVGFNPKIGYFISDNFALGADLSIGYTRQTIGTASQFAPLESKSNNLSLGAFGRYYFLDIGSRFKTYAEVGAGYLQNKSRSTYLGQSPSEVTQKGFEANAGIGANFFLTDRIAVNFSLADLLSYQRLKPDWPNAEPISAFSTNANVFNNFFDSYRFGLTFKF